MTPLIGAEVAAVRRLTTAELRRRFAELFGEPTHATNKPWLIRRIAWCLQALVEGDLSERARQRAAELVNDADLRIVPPRPSRGRAAAKHSERSGTRRPVRSGARHAPAPSRDGVDPTLQGPGAGGARPGRRLRVRRTALQVA
jgi:hypothetical protein